MSFTYTDLGEAWTKAFGSRHEHVGSSLGKTVELYLNFKKIIDVLTEFSENLFQKSFVNERGSWCCQSLEGGEGLTFSCSEKIARQVLTSTNESSFLNSCVIEVAEV